MYSVLPQLPDEQIVVGLAPEPGKVLITFEPSGAQVNARPGELMGEAARRSGLMVPYGCKQGVCGTCEAIMTQPNGQKNNIRVCSMQVPKTNLDAPDRYVSIERFFAPFLFLIPCVFV